MPEGVRIDSGDAAAAVRANACHALARAFDRPDGWPRDMGDLLLEAFTPCGGTFAELASEMDQELAAKDTALSVTHAKLFLGPFAVQAAPWASFYLDSEQQLMGPVSRYAAEAYAEAGLGPSAGPSEAPDHVTHELEFMYFLAFQESTTGDSVWLQRQRRFWQEHLGRWLPQLADAVQVAAADSPFYLRLARLTREFCAWQSGQLQEGVGADS